MTNNAKSKEALAKAWDYARALYSLGRAEMVKKKIPLWVAPLALVLLIGGCNMARGNHRGDIALCQSEFIRNGGEGKIRPTRIYEKQGIIYIHGRYTNGGFQCAVTPKYDAATGQRIRGREATIIPIN